LKDADFPFVDEGERNSLWKKLPDTFVRKDVPARESRFFPIPFENGRTEILEAAEWWKRKRPRRNDSERCNESTSYNRNLYDREPALESAWNFWEDSPYLQREI